MFKWLLGSTGNKIEYLVDANKSYPFKAETFNNMKVNAMSINECENEFLFEVKVIAKEESTYIFEWDFTYKRLFKGMDYLGENVKILEKLAGIKDHLILKVDNKGKIIDVLNRDELKAKWLDLKRKILNDPEILHIADNYRTQFFDEGDKEFSSNFPIEESLNKDQLYATFFFQNTTKQTSSNEDSITRIEQYSNVLIEKDKALQIPLIQSSFWSPYEKDPSLIKYILTRSVDNSRLNKGKIRDVILSWGSGQKNLTTYINDYSSEYLIDESSQILCEAQSRIFEKVNDNVEINQSCTITKIN